MIHAARRPRNQPVLTPPNQPLVVAPNARRSGDDLNFVLSDRLAQGGCPPMGHRLRKLGFAAVVLCAEEHQPPDDAFPGLDVVRVPFDDALEPMSFQELAKIQRAADNVARRLRAGQRVLVTCYAGRNRSGLVNALTLLRMTGAPPQMVIDRIRMRRGRNALSNPYFESLIRRQPRRHR